MYGLLTALLLVTLLGVVLLTFRDYGITIDEGVQHRYGRRIVRWYATLGAADEATRANDLYLYGGFFELCAQAAIALLPLGRYDARHLAGALFGVLGVVAAWGIGGRLGGRTAGLLSALFLALTPGFYGHFFANPKDLPFASLFALAAWVALWAGDRVRRLGWREVLLAGLAIGLAMGVRVAGLALCGAVAALWLGCGWLARREDEALGSRSRHLAGVLWAVAGVTAVAWAVMVAFWPWAQLDPLRNPLRAFRRFSHFWPDALVFFDGRLLLSGDLPRDYMPRLLALTLPDFYALAGLLGAWAVVSWVRERVSIGGKRAFQALWLAALATAPIAWVALRRTPVYNGIRHLLFVVPLLAVLAGLAVAAWFEGRRSRPARLAAASALAASLAVTLVDMVQLHPYQYLYFNRLFAGGLPGAAPRYETDYLCASYKEGIEWLAREYLRPDFRGPVRVDGRCSHVPFGYYLGRGAVQTTRAQPHVFFATTTFGDHRRTPGRELHVVRRQGVPLLYVFEQLPPR
jgi:4-amino-4-deoxy-L-arabinose transferase-like glycosyltransferase